MAAPTLASNSTATVAVDADSSFSLSAPSGISNGDLIILYIGCVASRTITTPTGFTAIAGAAGSSAIMRLATFYRIADGTETTWTLSFNLGYGYGMAIASRITNANASSFVSSTTYNDSWTTILGPGLTTADNDSLVLYGSAASVTPVTKPADCTDIATATYGGRCVRACYKAVATAGVVSDDSYGTQANGWVSGTVAVSPASGVSLSSPLIGGRLIGGSLARGRLVRA